MACTCVPVDVVIRRGNEAAHHVPVGQGGLGAMDENKNDIKRKGRNINDLSQI